MFCHQCEQAAKGIGCDVMGVCGKNPEVAALQDNLLYGLKGIAFFADKARSLGAKDPAIDRFVIEGLFATVTNVDFDPARLTTIIKECGEMIDKANALYVKAGGVEKPGFLARLKAFFAGGEAQSVQAPTGAATWAPAANPVKQGEQYGIKALHE